MLVCLSDAGSSSPHACSTSLSRAGMWEVTPNSLTFSSSWTKFLCFFFFCVSAIAGGSRPVLSLFPRAFRARGCGGGRTTFFFGRARVCGPADIHTTMSVWLLERSDHSEKQRTLLSGYGTASKASPVTMFVALEDSGAQRCCSSPQTVKHATKRACCSAGPTVECDFSSASERASTK